VSNEPSGNTDESSNNKGITRRRFIRGAAGTVGALTVGGSAALAPDLPAADMSSIEHVVVVMIWRNRSFDHFLGWVPGADGRQADLTYYDAASVPQQHITSPPTTRAVHVPIPTIPTRVGASSSTTARVTAGCEPGATASTPTTTRPCCA
jgi:phospholipase C